MGEPTCSGKSYEFTVDNGTVFHNTYAADGTRLHDESVAGPTAGTTEDVDLLAAEVAPGIFLVGWVEASGTTVTHAMNLHTNTVRAHWTYQTGDGRVSEIHSGRLTEL